MVQKLSYSVHEENWHTSIPWGKGQGRWDGGREGEVGRKGRVLYTYIYMHVTYAIKWCYTRWSESKQGLRLFNLLLRWSLSCFILYNLNQHFICTIHSYYKSCITSTHYRGRRGQQHWRRVGRRVTRRRNRSQCCWLKAVGLPKPSPECCCGHKNDVIIALAINELHRHIYIGDR